MIGELKGLSFVTKKGQSKVNVNFKFSTFLALLGDFDQIEIMVDERHAVFSFKETVHNVNDLHLEWKVS